MLKEYNKKRNFKVTPEPVGSNDTECKNPSSTGKASLSTKSRFVIQKHEATHLHYDLRLESKKNNVLISWAVPKGPSTDPKIKRLAILTEDHPIDYLLFEGNIPQGNYGAGSVIVWDTGTYTLEATQGNDGDLSDQFSIGKINFILYGHKLKGRFSIIKTSRENQWLLIKVNDEFSISYGKGKGKEGMDLIESKPESVLSGLTNDDLKKPNALEFAKETEHNNKTTTGENINTLFGTDNNNNTYTDPLNAGAYTNSLPFHAFSRKEFPDKLQPMLATLLNRPFSSQDWVFEVKWDGVRSLSFIHIPQKIFKIQSRNGNIITQRYPELTEPLKSAIDETKCKESIVFDGEIVVLDKKGFPDFQVHQKRMNINSKKDIESLSSQFPATYYIFDILYLDGFDLRTCTLLERRKILNNIIKEDNKSSKRIKISDFIEGDGIEIFESIKKMRLEGMVAKHKLGKYQSGARSREWLKIKNTKTQDCVIIGYTIGEGNREKYFGSILLAAVDTNNGPSTNGNRLKFIGHCGSGFDSEQLPLIYDNLRKIRIEKCPIDNVPHTNRETTWVRPVLVVEIKFSDWTAEKIMRAPIFIGFRQDKNPQDCIIEESEKRILYEVFDHKNKVKEDIKTETQTKKTKSIGNSN
jgi:bifunctional non-homologous end joining protein LigD